MFRGAEHFQSPSVVLIASFAVQALISTPARLHPRQDQANALTEDTITIAGKVYDASARTPLARANVTIKDSRLGTVSGRHGSFHLTLTQIPPFTIIILLLGYKSQVIGTGVFTQFHDNRTDWAASLDANYKLVTEMAAFWISAAICRPARRILFGIFPLPNIN